VIPADRPVHGTHPEAMHEGAQKNGLSAPACTHHAYAADCAGQAPKVPPMPGVTSAASARAHVLAVLEETPTLGPSEEAVTDLMLVTSELVSNAIRHGGGLVAFEATPTREGVRLAVYDRSAEYPSAAFGSGALPPGHGGVGGYGWPLIIRLARDVRIERCTGGGKIVSVLVPLV
jgi:anti-sigma regulatory factor (Ser/Thr protein kinase)